VKSSKSIRNALDDVEGMRENPNYLLKPLRQQAQAIEKTLAERETIASKLEAVNTKICPGTLCTRGAKVRSAMLFRPSYYRWRNLICALFPGSSAFPAVRAY
jgi:hypothetical protein